MLLASWYTLINQDLRLHAAAIDHKSSVLPWQLTTCFPG
jgi:hypothetical protein